MAKIVAMMVVGPGEGDRWLDEAITQRKELSDDIIICGNNTDKKTEEIIKKHDCWFYRDDREWGVNQPKIKEGLLTRVGKLKPSWVLASDADEIYDSHFTRAEANRLMATEAVGYYFAVINLWNDEQHYRHDASFWNIRFFRFRPELGLRYENKSLHCGLAPPYVYKYGWHAPFLLKHYGLMYPEDRATKKLRYDKYDPKRRFKSKEYYDKLEEGNNGLVRSFNEEQMHQRVVEDVKTHYKFENTKQWQKI